MGATWISWRTTAIVAALQIQALISVKTKTVTGVEGQSFNFTCAYPAEMQPNAKYFCNDGNGCSRPLMRTDKHNQWVKDGRFSLYDNATGAFFVVRVDRLVPEDSGTYWCGVDVESYPDYITLIQLNVSRANNPENLAHYTTVRPTYHSIIVDKHNLPLFLTAVMCVAALVFVFLFTLCLLLAVKNRTSGPRQSRETSCDYETMMAGERVEPEHCCSCSSPDCTDLSALPPPPPELCFHFASKQRESTVTLGLGEYVDADVSEYVCPYQHLDLSRLEEHIYHSLQENSVPKDRV